MMTAKIVPTSTETRVEASEICTVFQIAAPVCGRENSFASRSTASPPSSNSAACASRNIGATDTDRISTASRASTMLSEESRKRGARGAPLLCGMTVIPGQPPKISVNLARASASSATARSASSGISLISDSAGIPSGEATLGLTGI